MDSKCKYPDSGRNWDKLYYKYSHIGCPAAHYEDNCAHPDRCADNRRCLELGPNPFERKADDRP